MAAAAHPGRQVDLLVEGVGRLAEDRLLAFVRSGADVLDALDADQGRDGRGVDGLAAGPVDGLVVGADRPAQGPLPGRGQPQFLREGLSLRRGQAGGGRDQAGNAKRIAQQGHIGAGVADGEQLLRRVARGRNQVKAVEGVSADQIVDPVLQIDRGLDQTGPGAAVGPVEVVGAVAGRTGPALLIERRRQERETLGRFRGDHQAPAGLPPPVDVASSGQAIVDVASDIAGVAHGADAQLSCDDRRVEHGVEVARTISAVCGASTGLEGTRHRIQVGLVGDHPDRAAQRAGSEERALWAAQDLHALDVEQAQVGRAEPARARIGGQVVDEEPDRRLLQPGRNAGRDAPHHKVGLVGASAGVRQARGVGDDVVDLGSAAPGERGFRFRRDADGNVAKGLLALGRRDDHFLDFERLTRLRRSAAGRPETDQRRAGRQHCARLRNCTHLPSQSGPYRGVPPTGWDAL